MNPDLHIFTVLKGTLCGATKKWGRESLGLRIMRRMIGLITEIMRLKMTVEGVLEAVLRQLSCIFSDA